MSGRVRRSMALKRSGMWRLVEFALAWIVGLGLVLGGLALRGALAAQATGVAPAIATTMVTDTVYRGGRHGGERDGADQLGSFLDGGGLERAGGLEVGDDWGRGQAAGAAGAERRLYADGDLLYGGVSPGRRLADTRVLGGAGEPGGRDGWVRSRARCCLRAWRCRR